MENHTFSKWKALYLVLAVIVAIVVHQIPLPGLDGESKIMFAILALIAILWISEAIPLYSTAFLVPILTVIAGLLSPAEALSPFFSPVIALLLGGFILSVAIHKYGLDKKITIFMLSRAGNKPSNILLAVMATTAFLSMWISNTATTAIMVAIILPIINQIPKSNRFGKALILSVPFAANIGGMGTPIGTTPNPIAISYLAREGTLIAFIDWMVLAIPLQIIFLLIVATVLWLFFQPWGTFENLKIEKAPPLNGQRKWVIFISFLTIFLWLTGTLHGVPSSIIALIPVFLFTATGILNVIDYNKVSWDVLALIGGGLALGSGLRQSGLDLWLVGQLNVASLHPIIILLIFAGFTVLLTTFMSNTAAAALLIPVVGAYGLQYGFSNQIVFAVALASSAAMAMPVSTPPNAIAYGTKKIKIKDMLLVGGTISILSIIVIATAGRFWWQFLGY